ncbi:MAG: hypothetical protein WCH11_06715 [Bdellovibrio sp.]
MFRSNRWVTANVIWVVCCSLQAVAGPCRQWTQEASSIPGLSFPLQIKAFMSPHAWNSPGIHRDYYNLLGEWVVFFYRFPEQAELQVLMGKVRTVPVYRNPRERLLSSYEGPFVVRTLADESRALDPAQLAELDIRIPNQNVGTVAFAESYVRALSLILNQRTLDLSAPSLKTLLGKKVLLQVSPQSRPVILKQRHAVLELEMTKAFFDSLLFVGTLEEHFGSPSASNLSSVTGIRIRELKNPSLSLKFPIGDVQSIRLWNSDYLSLK